MNTTDKNYCRLCAELKPQNKLINLQTDEEKYQEIVNKLTRFNVQMNFDENLLPQVACFVCVNSLQSAFDFVASVEQAQSTLNDLILVRKIKKEENVSDDDNFVYEAPVSCENDVEIKIESDNVDSTSKLSKNAEKCTEVKKIKNYCNSLDALPLSQLKLSWAEYNWMCSYCETQFPSVDELRNHSMQYHKACNPYRCTDCKIRKLRLDSFLMHVKRHRKYLKFSCYKCPMKFTTAIKGARHSATHKTSNHICFGCNTNFKNQDDLVKHASTFYRDTQITRLREITIPLETDSLTCRICEKICKTKGSLVTHLLTHTERRKDHTCEICGKCFFHKRGLAEHMVQHTDARPFQCEICKLTFKTSKRLHIHYGVHNGEKPFACDQCGRCFRLKYQLANHSIIHTDSLPHVCTVCNKSFRFKTILIQHLRQHTGVKPYSCDICQRDFTNWSNYNKHMKRKHGMEMSKKKHTPDGVYPIDPATGEIIYPEADIMAEWKKKMVEDQNVGRPRINKKMGKAEVTDKQGNNI